ncbi:hypothetical protein [Silicimonas algicola]|uniref:PepSY domain-containing protein n=1 Tax=Silicimonas algicola TaxID=1826607 RepID=A0A316GBM7_9RHOB|nr:hypothetical protein [Silicimonas algicola]PWK58308.1 hypothetical protein C8D95_101114 [Silicimonas algicola]
MLKRVFVLIYLALAMTAPAAASPDEVRARIVAELREEGYAEIRISRTLLGRMRFVAVTGDRQREIVVNPATGLILRDYIRFDRSRDGDSSRSASGGSSGKGSGDDDDDFDDDDNSDDDDSGGNDDDSDDDDSDDDDGDDDNSGSGSSNSGED